MKAKFRAWSNYSKTIHEVWEIDFPTEEVLLSDDWDGAGADFRDVELMQSTGLKDKNGKEIYNHQKILVDSPKGEFEAKVVFELGSFGIVATKGRVCDYFEASWIDDFVPFIDLYVIESCEEDTLWMVEVAE